MAIAFSIMVVMAMIANFIILTVSVSMIVKSSEANMRTAGAIGVYAAAMSEYALFVLYQAVR